MSKNVGNWETIKVDRGYIIREHVEGKYTRFPCLYPLDRDVADHIVLRHNEDIKLKNKRT